MFKHVMAQHPPVDIMFFCNDDLTYRALLTSLRLKIDLPQRMAVAGFNHLTGCDPVLLAPMRVKTVARPQVDLS